MKILKLSFIIVSVLTLTACHQKVTYRDLFTSENLRTKLYSQCQMADDAKKQSRECEMVFNVMANTNAVYNQILTNGEGLGQQILDLQVELKKCQHDLLVKNQTLADLQKNKANNAEIQKTNDELLALRKTCHQKKDEINFIISLIGTVESPN